MQRVELNIFSGVEEVTVAKGAWQSVRIFEQNSFSVLELSSVPFVSFRYHNIILCVV